MNAAVFWIGFLGFIAMARSDATEDSFLHRFSHARSAREARAIDLTYNRIKIARRACVIQQQEHLLPLACYEWTALARQENLALLEGAPSIETLDRQCEAAISRFALPPPSASLEFLSAECARQVQSAWAVQAYRASDQVWPEF